MRAVILFCLLGLSLADSLGKYYINKDEIHVSGISAGAYMAVQLGVAFSSTIKGVGSVAGGPYYCAKANVATALTTCMSTPAGINVNSLIQQTNSYSSSGAIDDVSNIAKQKVYIYAGLNDRTVYPAASEKLLQYYEEFNSPANILTEFSINSGHAQITDNYGNACSTSNPPYINDCDYDQAGVILKHLHPKPLNPRTTMVSANLLEFDQSEFAATSLQRLAYVYVPTQCKSGNVACGLHVALHGCTQNTENTSVRRQYIEKAGYNEWAESNNIIILYPQCGSSVFPNNPNACFDWWGYAGADYATKNGVQMQSIKAMIDRLSSGTPTIGAPTGLAASSVGNTSVTLSWNPVSSAVAYRVYRDFAIVADSIATIFFTDSGLATGTTYQYTVSAIASGNIVGPQSSAISVTTTGPPPPLVAPVVQVTGVTANTVSLSWSTLSGASGYSINRDGVFVSNVNKTAFTDSGLKEQTTYTYTVRGFTSSGETGPYSSPVTATTQSGWVCQEYYTNNYQHVSDGRAYQRLGYVYALGSDQLMGLYNVATFTRLANTALNYYVIGNC